MRQIEQKEMEQERGSKAAKDAAKNGAQNGANQNARAANEAEEPARLLDRDSIWGALVGLLALLFLFIPVHPLDPGAGSAPPAGVADGLVETDAAGVDEESVPTERSNLGARFERGAEPIEESPEAPRAALRNSSFTITVKSADGSPVEGALIDLMGSELNSALRLRSDARGAAESPKLPAGFYELYAHRGELVSAPLLGVQLRSDEPKEVELILRRGQRLEGEVVRLRDGAPIRAATITVAPDTLSLMRREIHTDERGRFSLEGLHEGESTLHVEAEGYTSEGPFRVDPSKGALTIRLGLASSIEIAIADARGRPIEEAEILILVEAEHGAPPVIAGDRLSVVPGPVPPIPTAVRESSQTSSQAALAPGAREASLSILASGETDRFGELILEGLAPGRITIRAEADGSTVAISEPLELIPGHRARAALTLREGASLALRVRDEDGVPLGGARVRAEKEGDPFPLEVLTDESGEANLYSLDGSYLIRAFHGERESPAERLSLGIGERATLELRFEAREDALSGRVVDARGFGVSGAELTLTASDEGRRFEMALRTARDGTFAFEALPPPPYALRIEHPGYPSLEKAPIERGGELDPITLAPGGALRGELLDARSSEGIRAQIILEAGAKSDQRFEVMSDQEGSFVVDQLPLGRLSLRIEAEGYLPIRRTLSIESQERATNLGTLRLERAAAIEGTIVDRYGEPVFGATLALEGRDSPRARSDEAGRFLLSGLPSGRARLIATLRDGTQHLYRGPLQLRSGETLADIHFRLPHYEEPAPELPSAPSSRFGVPIEVVDEGGAIEIGWIAEGSEAARAGLRVGDTIVEINGERLMIAAQARAALRLSEGESVALGVRREGSAPRTVRLEGERYTPP